MIQNKTKMNIVQKSMLVKGWQKMRKNKLSQKIHQSKILLSTSHNPVLSLYRTYHPDPSNEPSGSHCKPLGSERDSIELYLCLNRIQAPVERE